MYIILVKVDSALGRILGERTKAGRRKGGDESEGLEREDCRV